MQGRRGGILKEEEETINKQEIKCPRCESTNTKFCYYNNYNLNQPRHYCKSCRRYWTKGGALRNVPVGGATRKINSKHPHSILTSSNSSSNYYPSSSKPQVPSVHDQQQYPITSDVTAGFFNISQYQYSSIDLGTHENFFGMQ